MAPRPQASLLPLYLRYEPETGKIFRLKNGKETGSISTRKDGYGVVHVLQSLQLAHRVAYALQTGEWPSEEIDHIDHNPINNKWSNLRPVSSVEQHRNLKVFKNNTSGHTGVTKKRNKWLARINVSWRTVHLGVFKTKEEAIQAYTDAKKNFHKIGTQIQ